MNNSAITTTEDGSPSYLTQLETYKIVKREKSYVILHMRRKGYKPRQVKRMKIKKGQTMNSVIQDVKNNKIKIRIDYVSTRDTPTNKVTVKQFNTKPRFSRNSLTRVQMIAIVEINDDNKNITTWSIGFSHAQQAPFTAYKIDIMKGRCIDYAVQNYNYKYYPHKKEVDNYSKMPDIEKVYGEIVQYRFQYVTNSRKLRKREKQKV